MKRGRIPRKLAAFITYVIVVNDYLHLTKPGDTDERGIVLGMTTNELAWLKTFVKLLMSGDPANPGIWDLHSNKDTKTHATAAKMVDAQKEFGIIFRPLLNRMNVSSSITVDDRIAMCISDPVTKHTRPTEKLTGSCYPSTQLLGGGSIKFACRPSKDSGRASKLPGSDALIIAYRIDPQPNQPAAASNELASKVKRQQIDNPDEGTTKLTFTKAKFTLELGVTHAGCTLWYYCRWIKSKYPDLSGPWTGPFSDTIS
jgi:hypothetical protein